MNKLLFVIYTAFCLSSCELDQELNVQDMGGSPSYFIECYCTPGEMFNLTATRIAPINQDQYLDYSIEFDIHVTTNERFKLYHSLFHEPGTKFIYNYASNQRLDRNSTDSILLDVTTPDGSQILASTKIPKQVKIDTVLFTENTFKISFATSPDPQQNFYILRAGFMENGELKYQNISYYDNISGQETLTHSFSLKDILPADSVLIDLKRMTQAGYYYQLSLREASDANTDNITSPTPLMGNISGALGIFTCYTNDRRTVICP